MVLYNASIKQFYAEERDACIEAYDVASPAERADDLQRELITARRVYHRGLLGRFAARRYQI